jgi:predicted transcriptional regulator of viral defense system
MNTYQVKKNKLSRSSDGERFAKLAELDENVFHIADLANLWNIRNKNTLHQTLSRYLKRGLIFRIYKGLYSIGKINDIDPAFMGLKALHRPAYISCETILYEAGILNQRPQAITFVSEISKTFLIGQRQYKSRQMADQYLFNDRGIEIKNGIRQATLPRALADMLYFNPRKYFDFGDSKMVNWREVKKVAKEVGYKINL